MRPCASGGRQLAWTDGDDERRIASDPRQVIAPKAFARLGRHLPAWGAGAGDFGASAQAETGGVASLLFVVGEEVPKEARELLLRGPDGSLDLTPGPVACGAWLRLRLASSAR